MGYLEFNADDIQVRKPWNTDVPFNFEVLEVTEPENHTSQAGNTGMKFEVTFRYWQDNFEHANTTWKKFYTSAPSFIKALCESLGMKMKGLKGFETNSLLGGRGQCMMEYPINEETGEKKKYPRLRDEGAFIYQEPLEEEPPTF